MNRITSLLSFIAEELGEEAVERALRSTGERFIRGRRDTGVEWGDLPPSARAKVVARAMLGNFGEVDVSEDDEKVVLSIRCGTGMNASHVDSPIRLKAQKQTLHDRRTALSGGMS